MKHLIYNNNLKHHLTQFHDFKSISVEDNDNPFLIMSNLKDCNELHEPVDVIHYNLSYIYLFINIILLYYI